MASSHPGIQTAGCRTNEDLPELRAEFVYLAVVIDRYSRKAVGWALDRNLAAAVAVTALQQAIGRRQPPPGVVHHSDQGTQYAAPHMRRCSRPAKSTGSPCDGVEMIEPRLAIVLTLMYRIHAQVARLSLRIGFAPFGDAHNTSRWLGGNSPSAASISASKTPRAKSTAPASGEGSRFTKIRLLSSATTSVFPRRNKSVIRFFATCIINAPACATGFISR